MTPEHEYVLWLVCSGRRSHKPKPLQGGKIAWWSGGLRQIGPGIFDDPALNAPNSPVVAHRARVNATGVIPPDPNADPGSGASRESYRFRCWKCPRRRPERKAETFWQLMEAARRGDQTEFDVSYLD
jgi:hypothetical protein